MFRFTMTPGHSAQPRLYFPAMRSKVAEELRQEQIDQVRGMTPGERVAMALQLGERDLRIYIAVQKVDRDVAMKAIRRSRQTGRRYSRCMHESLP